MLFMVDLTGFFQYFAAPCIVTSIGCAITYQLVRRTDRSNQTRPLVIENVVVPIANELQHHTRSGKMPRTFLIEQALGRFEAAYLPARTRNKIESYVALCHEYWQALNALNRAVQEAFRDRLADGSVPYTTSPDRGAVQMRVVTEAWVRPEVDLNLGLHELNDRAAPYALMGGGAPSYVFYIYPEDVQAHLEELRAIAHDVRAAFAHDPRPARLVDMYQEQEKSRERLRKDLAHEV